MKIRQMQLEDYEGVVEVWRRAGLQYRASGRDSREAIERQMEAYGNLLLVAEEDGRIVGVVVGSHDHRRGWINRLAVLPEFRRRGIAKSLIKRLEKEFEGLGLPVFSAHIIKGNEESMRLFESLGYERADEVIYFSKRLGENL
ncbi:MAG: GNAT family N-acetyltransferase [bacterium]